MEKATLIPIYKKGKDKKHPSSYRPISILSCLGKLLERIINTRLMAHLEGNNILSSTQSSYRKHRSTEDQLALLAQVKAKIASPYGPRVGCIRSSPYGHAHKGPMWDPDSKPIWAHYGMYTGLTIWARPYRTHMGPIRTSPYWHAHNGPMWGLDSKLIWAQCAMYTDLPIWTSP